MELKELLISSNGSRAKVEYFRQSEQNKEDLGNYEILRTGENIFLLAASRRIDLVELQKF